MQNPDLYVRRAVPDPAAPSAGVCRTHLGVLKSVDAGRKWSPLASLQSRTPRRRQPRRPRRPRAARPVPSRSSGGGRPEPPETEAPRIRRFGRSR